MWSIVDSIGWAMSALRSLCHVAMTRLRDAVLDPAFDISPSVSHMTTNTESWGTVAVVPPGVDGGDRHTEILGEIFHCEQFVEGLHGLIFWRDPLTRVSPTLSSQCQQSVSRPVIPVREHLETV